jgi:ATP-dependent Clp protease ATP-binding subunit ClpA
MLASSLEKILNDLFQKVRAENGQFIGVEHLLRALLDDTQCRDVLLKSGARIERLEAVLDEHIASERSNEEARPGADVQPTFAFQRTLRGAVYHVQKSGRTEVRSTDVLIALSNEPSSTAVKMLAEQGIERKDLLERLGATDSNAPVNAQVATAVNRCWSSNGDVSMTGPLRSRFETRLDELEAKLDAATGEIRELSAKLAQLIERLPPKS